MMQELVRNEDGYTEQISYDQLEDRIVVKTTYDASAVIEENAILRQDSPVVLGSKGQGLVLAMRIPEAHVIALKNEGYDLLSPDRDESRRAMLYVQQNQHKFLTTDKKMIAERKQKWR
jgi:hypothetical protein